jgi:hypothetical protein
MDDWRALRVSAAKDSNMPLLPEFIGARLKPLAAVLPASWRLWQYKSLNLHRGVIHWDATATPCTLPQIRDQVRGVVRNHFRPSWWRGFGFGAVVSLNHLDDSFNDAADLVDVRNNSQGVWQWIVLHFPTLHATTGVRTWTEGYLAPVYLHLYSALERSGYTCDNCRKDMDALMKLLIELRQKWSVARGVLDGLAKLIP